MDFEYSQRTKDLMARVEAFLQAEVYPNEAAFFDEVEANRRAGNAWVPTRVVEALKAKPSTLPPPPPYPIKK